MGSYLRIVNQDIKLAAGQGLYFGLGSIDTTLVIDIQQDSTDTQTCEICESFRSSRRSNDMAT